MTTFSITTVDLFDRSKEHPSGETDCVHPWTGVQELLMYYSEVHVLTSLTKAIEGASILDVLAITLLGLLAFLEPLHDLVSGQLSKLPISVEVVVIFVIVQTVGFRPEFIHRRSGSSFSIPFRSWLPGCIEPLSHWLH